MADFVLGTDAAESTLGGSQYKTVPFDFNGTAREIKFTMSQAVTGEDMEVHWLEIHFTVGGPSKEDL